jgi:thiol:disulfide interchange protein DsbD
MGLFTLELPQSVHSVEVEADRPFGSFLFGVFTAVLGLPCFGFFAGGLFAAAAALPSASIMAIFIGLGVGMALPYLVLSIYPSLLKFLPSVGPGSQLLKEVMGLCLLAAAAYFITVGVGVLLKERPYLSGVMMWWAVVFFIVLAGLWLVIRIFRVTRKPAARLVMPLVAIVLCLGSILFAQSETRTERNNYEERREAARLAMVGMSTSSTPVGIWLPYTPELLKAAQASGRPVFMDFTADWCITCKALKAAILNRDPVKSAFKDRGVVLIEVDCSVSGSVGSQKLAELGRTGVPTWAIYGPGNPRPQFVSVDKPTAATVLSALDEAGAALVPGGGKAASTGK